MSYFRKSSLLLFASVLLLSSCESQRTYYDEAGNEIAPEGVDAKTQSLEERFTSSFTMKKTEQGVPMATSDKVSSFQGKIDEARGSKDNVFETSEYKDISVFSDADRHSRWDGEHVARKKYAGSHESDISRDLRPDFLDKGRGVEIKEYDTTRGHRSDLENAQSSVELREIEQRRSNMSVADRNAYFEQRAQDYKQPKVINRNEYIRMTMEETRAMLGRDEE